MKDSEAKCLVSTVSWEPRFLLGLARMIDGGNIESCVLLVFHEWRHQFQEALDKAKRLAAVRGVKCTEVSLRYNFPEKNLQRLRALVKATRGPIVIDITTTPRDTALTLFFLLEAADRQSAYCYHKPQAYGAWLTRDPGRPRLLTKLAGISHIGRPTLLVIHTGFDVERAEQVNETFQPDVLALATETDSRYENDTRNLDQHQQSAILANHLSLGVNSCDVMTTLKTLEAFVQPFLDTHNVILASLGPKISIVPIYALCRKYDCIGVAYAPAQQFNPASTSGIDETLEGFLSDVLARSDE